MRYPRETIYQAFFTLVSGATVSTPNGPQPAFKSASRWWQVYTDILPEEMPSLRIQQIGENPRKTKTGVPYAWTLDVLLGVAVWAGQGIPNGVSPPWPASIINPVIDAIEAVLPGQTADPRGRTTLSLQAVPPGTPDPQLAAYRLYGDAGLVYDCAMVDSDHIFAGQVGNLAFAHIPCRIWAL